MTYFHQTSYEHYTILDHSKLVLSKYPKNFFFVVQQSKSGLYRVIAEVSRSHTSTMSYTHR